MEVVTITNSARLIGEEMQNFTGPGKVQLACQLTPRSLLPVQPVPPP